MDKRTIKRPVKERFFEKVKVTNDSEDCWEWQASKNMGGYGYFSLNRKCVTAHRACWIIHFGEIENHLMICHKCDNRLCVNPNHLYKGTFDDNMRDMFERKRNTKPPVFYGIDNPMNKLTVEQVKEIQSTLEKPIERGQITAMARHYGVDRKLLYNIKNKKIWKYV